MKKNAIIVLITITLFLTIPCLSLIGITPKPPSEDLPDDVKTYLVLNHETQEIMKLTPSEYIKGVVAAEMPISYNEEALKAQAIASHTYMIRQIGLEQKSKTPELNGAYISTDHKKYQAYISSEKLKERWGSNYDTYWKKLSNAVDEVIDTILVYENKPIVAAFHAISNGKTVNSSEVWGKDLPYLQPVVGEGDEMSPEYEKQTDITFDEFKSLVSSNLTNCTLEENNKDWLKIVTANEEGYVTKIKVGSLEVTGHEFRQAAGLRSATFTFEVTETGFSFKTKGYGHNVGMSQYSADFMARQGSKYADILNHFYPTAILSKI